MPTFATWMRWVMSISIGDTTVVVGVSVVRCVPKSKYWYSAFTDHCGDSAYSTPAPNM